jgi:single stranded DNA-binding protein
MNQVMLFGKVVSDPDLKEISSKSGVNTQVCKFLLSSSEFRKSQEGKVRNNHVFKIEVYSAGAQAFYDHIVRGDIVVVRGKLRQNKWVDHENVNHSEVVVRCEEFSLASKVQNREDDFGEESPISDYVGQAEVNNG